MKRTLLKIHLWTGLTLGLLATILGVSGSAIVFQPEIDRWLNPDLMRASPSNETAPLAAVVANAKRAYPGDSPEFAIFYFPEDDSHVYRALMKEGFAPDDGPFMEAFVDPSDAAVLGIRDPHRTVVGTLISLHANLLAGEETFGQTIVGLVGVLVLPFFIVTGLILWWPGLRRIAHGFKLHLKRGLDMTLRSMHRVAGALLLLLLILPILTGALLTFPDQVGPPLESALDVTQPEPAPPVEARGRTTIDADQALAAAQARVANAEVTSLLAPEGDDSYWQFRFWRPGEPDQHYQKGRLEVLVEPFTSPAVHIRDETELPIGDKLMRIWYFPTHTGEIFGIGGRVFMVIAGLTPAFLFATGLVTWWRRRQRRRNRARATTSPPALADTA